ncbi:prolipoprotein diacylglyceryl transferase [Pedosphaera parvula]|uniref:Prolipoprotein diacylglyceryl transferase n=1 Tax=Pedosphaera parvula (strain Ellin514) TaxID=320771 RepID=B9XBU6_PEDPL|nr:prolipoprotein diacylglyceryl transferase family protein [Pedosphaera parvula]EEF62414.1 prolipoprotein diacylglyceryl transferase [Pedosphaera parvula Ellin514]
MRSSPYGWLMLAGIIVSICFWSRLAKRDDRLLLIYVSALVGAFLGAKIVYVLAEGWLHFGAPDMWLQLATGKTILGALLGGYLSVEIAKKLVGYHSATGDWFAFIAPIGIILGRIGCFFHGCCTGVACKASWCTLKDAHGVDRWPSVPMEILFNFAAIVTFFLLRRRQKLNGQHFHIYLMAYGIFRFMHEFVREEPHILGPMSGYQIAALAVFALGMMGFIRRQHQPVPAVVSS